MLLVGRKKRVFSPSFSWQKRSIPHVKNLARMCSFFPHLFAVRPLEGSVAPIVVARLSLACDDSVDAGGGGLHHHGRGRQHETPLITGKDGRTDGIDVTLFGIQLAQH